MTRRRPVRAAIAFAAAGSLGTFLSGAGRAVLLRMMAHNAAVADGAPDDDRRYLRPDWGRIVVDAVGGASAGAICATQVVRALYDPSYLGVGFHHDTDGTMSGDWVHRIHFETLANRGLERAAAGPIEGPGWTFLSAARMYELLRASVTPSSPVGAAPGASLLDDSGIVAVGMMLTDLLGFSDPAEFAIDDVLGHPSFGCAPPTPSRVASVRDREVRDLGGTGHGEVRRLMVVRDDEGAEVVRRFLTETRRRGRARALHIDREAMSRLAALAIASASLPVGVGPVALTDRAADVERVYRRLYLDGGLVNDKPVSPALQLARWHDMVRLLRRRDADGSFSVEAIREELVYDRVLFFVDAFPDRAADEWVVAQPGSLFDEQRVLALSDAALRDREDRIDRSLDYPYSGVDAFLQSVLTSLRARDLREIAETNARLRARERYIDRLCERGGAGGESGPIMTVERAMACAAVLGRPGGPRLDEDALRRVSALVAETDGFSHLDGRRSVRIVPVFAPANLESIFAGEGMYALGGLLSVDARRHDAGVGEQVAHHVMDALGRDVDPVTMPEAPESALPDDATPVVDRIRELARATIDGQRVSSPVLKWFGKLPLGFDPVRRAVTSRINGLVRGSPPPVEPRQRAGSVPDDESVDDAEPTTDAPDPSGP